MKLSFKILMIMLVILSLLNCNSSNKHSIQLSKPECIKNVIAFDDSLGTIRNHACEKISLSKTIQNYTYALENIDFSNCPTEFSNAFNTHINAWKNMMSLTNKYPNLRAEMHALFDTIKQGKDSIEFKPLLDNIWSTWTDIEKTLPLNNN